MTGILKSVVFKVLATLLFCKFCEKCANGFTIEDIDRDIKYIKLCNRTSPVSLYAVNQVLMNHKLLNLESRAFKCFLNCLYVKYGWMDEDGGFLIHHIKNFLLETEVEIDNLDNILYTCTAFVSSNRCERSYLFTECFWGKMKEQNLDHDDFQSELSKK